MNYGRTCLTLGISPWELALALTLVTLILSLAWPQAAPAQGTWSGTGSLMGSRRDHTATRLADGRVLAAGGLSGGNYLSSTELFNPAIGTWSPTNGPMATARRYYTATLLTDGRVLAAGGLLNGNYLPSSELFNPAIGTWSPTNGPLATARIYHTATWLADGRVLVAGGIGNGVILDSAELFNPATGIWSGAGPLAAGRYGHTATGLADGRVLVAGGSNNINTFASVELFNPANGTWSTPGPMGTARFNHTATRLADGRVLAAGGINGFELGSAELFNPATGTWSPAGPLATARFNHTATRLADGRVLVAGGNDRIAPLTSAEIFNPATETWSPAGPLATGRDGHTATPLADGRVLVAGGIDGPVGPAPALASAEVYDPLNFLGNGSFESAGVDPGVGFITLPNGNTTITQWVVASGGIDYTVGAWQAAEGRRSLDLNALSAGSIQQSIATVAGDRYLVTFALAGNPAAPAIKTLRVFAGVQSQDFSFDSTGKSTLNMGWTGKSLTFTATGPTTILRFQSLTDGANGPALDQVRVIRAASLPFLPLLLD